MNTTTTTQDLILTPSTTALIDELGTIRAEIKRLQELNAELTDVLKLVGAGKYKGMTFKATISEVAAKKTINWQAVAMHFGPSSQLLTAHTTTGTPSLSALISKI